MRKTSKQSDRMKTNINKDEYGEYYGRYVKHSNGSDLAQLLSENRVAMAEILKDLNDAKALYRYEEGKWSIKEVLGHVIDTERIFNYRVLLLARGEERPLPGYDQDHYMKIVNFDRYSVKELQSQYSATRDYTLSLFGSFSDEEMISRGVINGSSFTVRAVGYVIAGHEMHHRSILKEKYHLTGSAN